MRGNSKKQVKLRLTIRVPEGKKKNVQAISNTGRKKENLQEKKRHRSGGSSLLAKRKGTLNPRPWAGGRNTRKDQL